MDTENNRARKLLAYATGAASILDLSGDDAEFRELLRPRQRAQTDWEAIGRDFEAVGGYLTKAMVSYFEGLPQEKKREILRTLRERER